MPTIKGKLENIEDKESSKGGYSILTIDNLKYGLWDKSWLEGKKAGDMVDFEYTEIKKGEYTYRNIIVKKAYRAKPEAPPANIEMLTRAILFVGISNLVLSGTIKPDEWKKKLESVYEFIKADSKEGE